MRALKVWGGSSFISDDERKRIGMRRRDKYHGTQVRTIVAATTKKRAMEIIDVSRSEFDGYWSETGNAEALAAARVEGVWHAELNGPGGDDYKGAR